MVLEGGGSVRPQTEPGWDGVDTYLIMIEALTPEQVVWKLVKTYSVL